MTGARAQTRPHGHVHSAQPAVFRKEGEYWTLVYCGETARLRDSKGLQHIAQLMRHRGQQVASTDLVTPKRSDPEQARVNVTRAIRSAVKRITDNHPVLGEHLVRAIRTGRSCLYDPDPQIRKDWLL